MSYRSREAWFRELARLAPVGMFITDDAGDVVLVNERWCEITGLSENDARHMKWLQSVHPEDRERVTDELILARAKGSGYTLEYRLVRPDGGTRWVISKVAPLLDSQGIPESFIGALMDVASKKDIENHVVEATRQLGEIIRFKVYAISNLQHELRTPLNGIIGISALLKDEITNAEHSMYVEMIHESSIRLSQTIDRIIQHSHLESVEFRPDMKRTNLLHVVQTVAQRFVFSARRKGLELEADLRDEGPEVLGDVGLLQQALGQVLDNALKFTPSGSVRIALQEVEDGQLRFAEISVSDTGIGIPEEFQQTVFQPFRQVSEGPARRYEGIGLGLALAKMMIEEMNGEISLHSEPMKGTRVIIRFPGLPGI